MGRRLPTGGRHPLIAGGERLSDPQPLDSGLIGKAYGTDARRWFGDARSWADLGGQCGAGLSAAEVDWMTKREWAISSEDVLWRRSKLGLILGAECRRRLAADFKEQAE